MVELYLRSQSHFKASYIFTFYLTFVTVHYATSRKVAVSLSHVPCPIGFLSDYLILAAALWPWG
jgi:hypothetical protein